MESGDEIALGTVLAHFRQQNDLSMRPVNFRYRAGTSAFTLVELMIVVGILGLLLMISIPGFMRARENAANSRYASDMRVVTTAFIQYDFDNRSYPADTLAGQMPAGMEDYLKKVPWDKPDAMGGQWDWDYKQFGTTAGVSTYMPTASLQQLQRYDAMVDDGNLETGDFHARNNGYITVIEW
jgi:prepilin-type N-terminal cleavage/methylation domain-containing protein